MESNLPQADAIASRQVANILRKLQAGKVLTEKEQEQVHDWQATEEKRNRKAGKRAEGPWPETISAVDLCELTGLTDRRHRQLAQESYFPPKKKGQYATEATLRGLFRYYRDGAHANKDLKAKKTQEEIRKLKLFNDQKEGELIVFDQVEQFMVGIVAAAKTEARRLRLELPPKIIGLERAESEIRIGEELDRVFTVLAQLSVSLSQLKADAQKAADEQSDDGANAEARAGKPEGVPATGEARAGRVDRKALPARAERRGL